MKPLLKRNLTTQEILKLYPTLKPSTLDYLIRNGVVTVFKYGKGIPRSFTEGSLTEIENWLQKMGRGKWKYLHLSNPSENIA